MNIFVFDVDFTAFLFGGVDQVEVIDVEGSTNSNTLAAVRQGFESEPNHA